MLDNEEFRFSILASGSTGNAVYLEAGKTRLLIDAGVSLKQLKSAMQTIDVDSTTLSALVVTHEHSDHVKGLKMAVKNWALPIYTSEGTWHHISKQFDNEEVQGQIVRSAAPFSIDQVVIEPFRLSHDAEEPLGFCFHYHGKKLVVATDLGYVDDRIRSVCQGADAFILETNHDVDMVRNGPYPWHLKRRILGDKGHLSNETAAEFLIDTMSEATHTVCMAHLSQENNAPHLAKQVLYQRLSSMDHERAEQITLAHTYAKEATPLYSV